MSRQLTPEQEAKLLSGMQPVRYPGKRTVADEKQYEDLKESIKQAGRAAWQALHTMQDPSPEKLSEWLGMVPSAGCGCQNFASEFLAFNPPPYRDADEFFVWTWRFHDAVDQKLGDARMTLEEARAFWGR